MRFVTTGAAFAAIAVTCAVTAATFTRTFASGVRICGRATRPQRVRKRATFATTAGTCVATGATAAPIGVTSGRTVVIYGRTAAIPRSGIPPKLRNRMRAELRGGALPAPQLGSDPLRVAQHAQDIQSSHLFHVCLSPTASQQFRDQIRKFRDVFQTIGHFRDAVEIGADADVIDTGDLPDMIDVIGDLLERRVGRS